MSVIRTERVVDERLDQFLQDVLATKQDEWNYFFEPHRIKEVFTKLADHVQRVNFFTSDYSINTFLEFLKAYTQEKLTAEHLVSINTDSLREFDRLCRAVQIKIIGYKGGLNASQQQVVSHYLTFLRKFMEHPHRNLFAKSEIKLNSADLSAIAGMLKSNSASINDDLIQQYIVLLTLSFDVPSL
jgi:hypothetical protein